MSHRMRLTVADRVVDAMLADYPELLGIDHVIDAASKEAFSMCDDAMRIVNKWYHGEASASDILSLENMEVLRPDHVALWSRWRSCRHVYRFDRNLSEALSGTDSPDDMPIESLRMLPYPIVFVDARIGYPTVRCNVLDAQGFFAWCEEESLQLVFVCTEKVVGITVHMDGRTLGEAIDTVVDTDSKVWGEVGEGYALLVRDTITSVVAHLLYIVSDNSEQEVIYRPSGNASRRKTSQSTVHAVGTRVGRALGQARVRYEGRDAGGQRGGTVRTHMRSGHWHHFWTGKRSDQKSRKLILRWVNPTLVSGRGGDANDTVVHEAKA